MAPKTKKASSKERVTNREPIEPTEEYNDIVVEVDKAWMSMTRVSREYREGVKNFLQFAKENAEDHDSIRCPCINCANCYRWTLKEIKAHLIINGIDETHTKWIWHGEKVSSSYIPSFDIDNQDFGMEAPEDLMETLEMVHTAQEEFTGNPETFQKLLEDAHKPLYKGCTKCTKLSSLVKLFNLKAKSGWTDTSFSKMLELFAEMLPSDNELPLSTKKALKTLSMFGMGYEKIHACPNDCILYRTQYNDSTTCLTCGTPRYKLKKNTTKEKVCVPAKILWYFSPIPRFKRWYLSTQTSQDLTWHANGREVDDKLRHPADSLAWKLVDNKWPSEGVGKGATPTNYFHLYRHGSKQHIKNLESQLNEANEREKDLLARLMKYEGGSPALPPSEKIKGNEKTHKTAQNPRPNIKIKGNEKDQNSTLNPGPNIEMNKGNGKDQNSTSGPSPNIGKSNACKLVVDSRENIVAIGLAFEGRGPNDTLHNVCLGENLLRVSITSIFSPDTLLPVPNFKADLTTVGNALGTYVAWPKELVLFDNEIEAEKISNMTVEKISNMAFGLHSRIQTMGTIEIPIGGMFGDNLQSTFVPKEEILRVSNLEKLDFMCVIAYIRFLYERFPNSRDNIKFLNPESVRDAYAANEMDILIMDRLTGIKDNQSYLIPINISDHWVLLVIEYPSMNLFWLDSLHRRPSTELKNSINNGFRLLVVKGKRTTSPTWEYVLGPRQPFGSILCGYYVLRFMRHLMEDPMKSLKLKMKDLKYITYDNDDMHEVQFEILELIQQYVVE